MLHCWNANLLRSYWDETGSRLGLTVDQQALELSLPRHYAEETRWAPPKPGPGEWMEENNRVRHTCQPELRFAFAKVLGVPMPTPNVLFDVTLRCVGAYSTKRCMSRKL